MLHNSGAYSAMIHWQSIHSPCRSQLGRYLNVCLRPPTSQTQALLGTRYQMFSRSANDLLLGQLPSARPVLLLSAASVLQIFFEPR